MNINLLLGFFFFIFLVQKISARDVSKELNQLILRPINFVDEVNKGILQVDTGLKGSEQCVEFISDKLGRIDLLQSSSFFPQNLEEIRQLEEKGNETLGKLFQIQLTVRKKQQELSKKGRLTFECLQNIRRSTRYLRFMEDMLIEWLIEQKKMTSFAENVLGGQFPQVMRNPEINSSEPFLVGDIFLIRGKSIVSAMIARIGDTELQFSHLAIIGLNLNNERVIVEALIPYGTRITPFDQWMRQKEARVVHFRYSDTSVALKAGKAAYELANSYISKNKINIPYDFHMSSLDADQIFCAELIENAYLTASASKVLLPEYKSMTTKFKSTPFLKNMGIEASEIFAPGDIEFDSRFNLVAEYRFLGKIESEDTIPILRKVRMQDAIIQSLYNWMTLENFQFVDSWKINLKTILAKLFRYFGFFKDRMPTHIPYSSLKTIIQFEDTSHLLQKHLFEMEKKFYQQHKHSMHFQEMLRVLVDYRDGMCRDSQSEFVALIRSNRCPGE
ncbi:MAG: hypothetical protein JNL11_00755 [Bdellovibrionaceae bacterium]|nr:hypothetical protein [Pseudobdellovibrionaceae bacterium]